MTPAAQPSTAQAQRQVILVVGMHRSGTSAVTRMISLLGAALPEDLLPGNFSNVPGHWEPANLVSLHEEMLRSAGSSWDETFGVDPHWFESESAQKYEEALAKLIQFEYPASSLLVVKDPRLGLFIPVWKKALSSLDIQPLFVLPFRHPEEVELSLEARHARAWPDAVWPTGRGQLLWLRHVLAAEKATRGQLRSFVSFDSLLDDWHREAARIAEQLNLVWPREIPAARVEIDEFLSRRHKHQTVEAVQSQDDYWTVRVHDQLQACVAEPQEGADVFDAAQRSLEESSRLFRPYLLSLQDHVRSIPSLKAGAERALKQAKEAAALRDAEIQSRDQRLADMSVALQRVEQEVRFLKSARAKSERELALAQQDAIANNQLYVEAARSLSLQNREIQGLLSAARALRTELNEARQQVGARDARIRALEADLARAHGEIAARQRKEVDLSLDLKTARADAAASSRSLAKTSRRLQAIEASIAWRATYPFRAGVTLARRLTRGRP